jgi:hypothetical protein
MKATTRKHASILFLTLGAWLGGCEGAADLEVEDASTSSSHVQHADAGSDPSINVGSRKSDAGLDDGDAEGTDDATRELVVDKAFWFEGWRVLLRKATHRDQGSYGEVVFDAEFEKLFGNGLSSFREGWDSRDMLLVSGDTYAEVDTDYSVYPELPYGKPGEGSLYFRVEPEFALDDAVLYVGVRQRQRAVIPLGQNEEPYVSLKPLEGEMSDVITVGDQTFRFHKYEVTAEDRDQRQVDADTLILTITFDIELAPSEGYSGANVLSDHFKLEGPQRRLNALSGTNELLYGGDLETNVKVRFQIPKPYDGDYTLVLLPDGTDEEGRVPLSIRGTSLSFP